MKNHNTVNIVLHNRLNLCTLIREKINILTEAKPVIKAKPSAVFMTYRGSASLTAALFITYLVIGLLDLAEIPDNSLFSVTK